jgi:hypothetical protein
MGEILSFFHPERAFDPETTIAPIAAYEKALGAIENDGQADGHSLRRRSAHYRARIQGRT